MYKSLRVHIALLALVAGPLSAQFPGTGEPWTAADSAWAGVYLDTLPTPVIHDSMARGNWIRYHELQNRRFRDRGLILFDRWAKNDPHPERRYGWLVETLSRPPYYYQDIEQASAVWDHHRDAEARIDTVAARIWDRRMLELRKDLDTMTVLSSHQKQYMNFSALRDMVGEMSRALRNHENIDSAFSHYTAGTLEYANDPQLDNDGSMSARALVQFLISDQTFLQRDSVGLHAYLTAMQTSKNSDLALYAVVKERLFRFRGMPIEMQFGTLHGGTVDLASHRGKVVLVDFWNNGCSACIEAFPKIKAVYEQYHKKGFDVISVALEPDTNRTQVQTIVARHKLPWTQAIAGGDDPYTNRYVEQYQIYGLPEMFLLDQQGHLVANGYINEDELLGYLNNLLGPSAFPRH